VILSLIASWYHLVPHFGFVYGYQVWLYICFAFWAADRLARVARIAFYNRIGNSKAIVEPIPDCEIIQVTVFPRSVAGFGPGQHSFLYLPGLGRFWENHPFSVAGWKRQDEASAGAYAPVHVATDSEDRRESKNSHVLSSAAEYPSPGRIGAAAKHLQDRASVLHLVRAHSGATSSLRRRALEAPGKSLEVSAYTEGPYAGHRATLQSLLVADTVLCLVGGIGITNALGFVQEFANAQISSTALSGRSQGIMRQTKRVILAWSARELALITYVKQNLLNDIEGIEYSFWCTGSAEGLEQNKDNSDAMSRKEDSSLRRTSTSVGIGRMDISAVINASIETGYRTSVLVCGPGGMMDEAAKHVVNCVKAGSKVDMIEEAFTW
jgi:ferredoxin-NADP reductase